MDGGISQNPTPPYLLPTNNVREIIFGIICQHASSKFLSIPDSKSFPMPVLKSNQTKLENHHTKNNPHTHKTGLGKIMKSPCKGQKDARIARALDVSKSNLLYTYPMVVSRALTH